MTVKRYDTDRDGEEYESETGPFVHFTDYAALAAELVECAAVRDSWCAEFVKVRDALAHWEDAMRAVDAEHQNLLDDAPKCTSDRGADHG
jgi:hypothetical protein